MAAKDSLPMRDSISLFLVFFFFASQLLKSAMNTSSLSWGRQDSILAVLSRMPRKMITMVGPSTFATAIGKPRRLQASNIFVSPCWQSGEEGMISVIWWLWCRIHSRASVYCFKKMVQSAVQRANSNLHSIGASSVCIPKSSLSSYLKRIVQKALLILTFANRVFLPSLFTIWTASSIVL